MRVLFTSTAGDGHLLPLMPLAKAFVMRGDDVAVAAAANHRERIERAGLRFEQTGPTIEELRPEIDAHRERMAKLPPAERRPAAFSGRFATIEAPRRVRGLSAAVQSCGPDVVIHEPSDLAAPLVAVAAAGVPTIHHAFGRPIPADAARRAAETMAPLWRDAQLEPDELAGMYRGGYVEICPPSLRAELPRQPAHTYVVRPAQASADDTDRDRPYVYATLGTVVNELRTFRLLLDAFEQVNCDVIMTVGRNRDPRDLEQIPANVSVESYVPQEQILPRCDAVVAHAGSGTIFGALAHGLPLMLAPQGADQFDNADACEALGVAEKILPVDLTVERVREALERILDDPTYAVAARTVAAEIADMPLAAAAVEDIASHL